VHEPYVIVSADSHAGLPTERYREYLASQHHAAFDEFLASRHQALAAMTALGVRDEDYATQWFEEHAEDLRGGWDAAKRDEELDGDGVAGEVVFPDADAVESRTCVPFGAGLGMSGDMDPVLGLAGAQAHNRWLAELCATSPDRRRGVALVPITAPIDDVLAEIRRAKESGLAAVMIPAMWMSQLPYHDRSYDPVWALCQDLQMPVATHSGPADRDSYGDHLGIYVTEVVWWPARPLWFMLFSGVFERFPGLRFGVTEAGCWWVPGLLWFWDRLYLGQKGSEKLGADPWKGALAMRPSEYFDRNCYIGASNTKRRELGLRYEIGVDNNVPRHPDRRDPPHARPRRGRGLRLRPRRAAPHRRQGGPHARGARPDGRRPRRPRPRRSLDPGEGRGPALAHRPRLPTHGVAARRAAGPPVWTAGVRAAGSGRPGSGRPGSGRPGSGRPGSGRNGHRGTVRSGRPGRGGRRPGTSVPPPRRP
jgi:hypothetical protein